MVTNTATVAHDAYTLETTPVVYGLNCDQMVLKIDCATHPFFELPRVRTTRFKSSFSNYAVDHYVWSRLILKCLIIVSCRCSNERVNVFIL